jgi:hypothetical protein
MASDVSERLRQEVAERAYLLELNHDNRLRERETLVETGRYPTIEALARMKE